MNYTASHLRFHIKGNAMYRMGPTLSRMPPTCNVFFSLRGAACRGASSAPALGV